jgi:hypothetical protein
MYMYYPKWHQSDIAKFWLIQKSTDFPGKQAKKPKILGPHKKKRHYTSIKKKCQIECRKAYNNYVSTMISDDIKSNPNRLWSFIKSKRCDSTGVTPFTKGGSLEKANILNILHQFFLRRIQLMCTNYGSHTIPWPRTNRNTPRWNLKKNLLSALNPNKATGPDNISGRF